MSTLAPDVPASRPLGAFERTIDLFIHRNPVQFSLSAVFDRDLSEGDLAAALARLQAIHPLLRVAVDRDEQSPARSAFRPTTGPIPIRVSLDSTWQEQAALEQTSPLDAAPGPLARVVLVPGHVGAGATVVVTVSHQIADGRGALRAVTDLVALLDGASPSPSELPDAQEDLLASLSLQVEHAGDQAASAGDQAASAEASPAGDQDPSPRPAGRLRPFDGSPPDLQPGELREAETRRLVERSRSESCSVQAALCAAAASVLFSETGQDQVRINVPIDLRGPIGLDDAVVVRFGAAMIALDEAASQGFWDLARSAAAQLEAARQPATLQAGALMLAQFAPSTPDEAEAAMLGATAADIEITNLGVTDMPADAGGLRELWGPTMTTQVEGEQILGVVTHGGVLRLVNVTHAPIEGLVGSIQRELAAACAEPVAEGR